MNPTWTPSARRALDRFLEDYRSRTQTDVDADEVTADLRRHVEEELAAAGLPVVTEADVARLVARLDPGVPVDRGGTGFGEPGGTEQSGAKPESPPKESLEPPTRPGRFALGFWLMAGVLLPLVACVIEWVGDWCAEAFFDPLPSAGYGLLALAVPLANLVAWAWVRKSWGTLPPRWLVILNAVSAGVATYFTILFLPLTPLAIPAIVFFGLGFLPLAPAASLLVALQLGRRMGRSVPKSIGMSNWVWNGAFFAPLVVLCLLSLPGLLTMALASKAVSGGSEGRVALERLRRWGDSEQILKACYGNMRGPIENWFGVQLNEPDARKLYFQVTGHSFNSVRPPVVIRSRRSFLGETATDDPGTEWDEGIGGESVLGSVRGLTLTESRLDGLVGATEGTSYVEWTFEFKNSHPRLDREARMQLQLPPGGVVSRLTLWVNGEEREAAFASRSQTREAYQKIAVAQRRDPVLVTTSGPDRVMVQCFPVPPRGGSMKIRVGITAPLHLRDERSASMEWPHVLERNFKVPTELRHALWMEASMPLKAATPNLKPDDSKPGRPALHGSLTSEELASGSSRVMVERQAEPHRVWAADTLGKESAFIRQRLESRQRIAPNRLAVVIDESSTMASALPEVIRVLQNLPMACEFSAFVASDDVMVMRDPKALSGSLKPGGGKDNVAALERAWDWAAEKPGGLILWVHGPQPELLGSAGGLVQRIERQSSTHAPVIHDLPVVLGPNRVVEKLDGVVSWIAVPRNGTLEQDLTQWLSGWSGKGIEWRWVRERVPGAPSPEESQGRKGSDHVVRLYVLDQVRAMMAARQFVEAGKLAARYQLVTPASGAVVLENRQQYEQTGLTPVDPATVPLVPEPGVVVLLLVGIGVWGGARLCRVRREQPHPRNGAPVM